MMAAHVSRHGTLTEWIDASILDETNPEVRDPELDLYGSLLSPPFSEDFLERYRAAQIARNRKITAWVKNKLDELQRQGRVNEEFAFVTHGTMADPRWLDPAVDPNDRIPGTCYLGDPKVVNNGPVGLARFCTLRSWLSQWSIDDANACGPSSLGRVSVPVLVVPQMMPARRVTLRHYSTRLLTIKKRASTSKARITTTWVSLSSPLRQLGRLWTGCGSTTFPSRFHL